MKNHLATAVVLWASLSSMSLSGLAEDPKGTSIVLAGGKLVMQMPKDWKKETPKSRIVDYEFSAPVEDNASGDKPAGEGATKAEQDSKLARITIMGAGGSVEANIERWYGQFENATKSRRMPRSRNSRRLGI